MAKIRDWNNLEVLQRNRLDSRAYFMSYGDVDSALTFERGRAKGFKLLNGMWKFHYSDTPEEAPDGFYEEDFDVEVADVVSTMYSSHERMEEHGKKENMDKPHILCEYVHAMGNGLGGLKDYWNISGDGRVL